MADVAPLENYIRNVYDHEPKHHGKDDHIALFSAYATSPLLLKKRTNRILVYYGAFNPPHRGHLRLLKHTFERGCHDLNMIAAIIRPCSDDYVLRKCRDAGGSFAFSRDDRAMLWKRDLCFPNWAWVHEGRDGTFNPFMKSLKQVASKDGFRIEYVRLRGPTDDDHESPPGLDDFTGEGTMLIISDAARVANYQRLSGRIQDFYLWKPWKRVNVDVDALSRMMDRRRQVEANEGAVKS